MGRTNRHADRHQDTHTHTHTHSRRSHRCRGHLSNPHVSKNVQPHVVTWASVRSAALFTVDEIDDKVSINSGDALQQVSASVSTLSFNYKRHEHTFCNHFDIETFRGVRAPQPGIEWTSNGKHWFQTGYVEMPCLSCSYSNLETQVWLSPQVWFTHTDFSTQTRLHTDPFTHRHFDTQTLKRFYTQKLWHTDAFTHRCFYTQKLLHTNTFTHRGFYTQKLSHTEAFTHRSFHTQKLLHTNTFTHKDRTREIAILPQFLPIEPHFVRKGCVSCRLVGTAPRLQERNRKEGESKRAREHEGKRASGQGRIWRCEDVKMRRCEDEKLRRWADVKMRRCEDVKMRRCEDEKM